MRPEGPRPAVPAARHARVMPFGAPVGVVPARPPGPPPSGALWLGRPPRPPGGPQSPATLSLVLSRKARREAVALAAAASTTDPRVDVIESLLTAFRVAGDLAALALSTAAWIWLAGHRSAVSQARAADGSAGDGAVTVGGPLLQPLLHPLVGISGTALVLLMLMACLFMAPSVNPFYAAPPEHRVLQISRTATFAVLALSTVAVVAGAASA